MLFLVIVPSQATKTDKFKNEEIRTKSRAVSQTPTIRTVKNREPTVAVRSSPGWRNK